MTLKVLIRCLVLPFALALSTSGGCSPTRGTVRTGGSDPLVVIEAGLARVHGGGFEVRYLIDRSTRTCWLVMGDSVAPLDCCALRRVEAARAHLDWDACAAKPTLRAFPGAPGPEKGPDTHH
jgi:hypothetical protein